MVKYLRSINVYFDEKEINKVFENWSGVSKRTFIKYDQFNKIFKQVGNETMTGFKNQNKAKSQAN